MPFPRCYLQATFLVALFAGKIKRSLGRYRRRRQLIQEWIDLEVSNAASIVLLTRKAQASKLSPAKVKTILCGLGAIQAQSAKVAEQLRRVLVENDMHFGAKIIDICSSFEAYGEFLQSYAERQAIMKELDKPIEGESRREINQQDQTDNRIEMEETAQRIVFRTYKLSLLVERYLKNLRGGKEEENFRSALSVLTRLNKKHDHLLRHEQGLKQKDRIERLMGSKADSNLVYSEKCHWHKGEALLHIFQAFVAVEAQGEVHCIGLDRYCSVFSKSFDGLHMGCLVAKTTTLHLLFQFSRQLTKFLRVLENLIRFQNYALTSTQNVALFTPFLCAQVVDFREGRDLKGNRREEFTIIFSALCQQAPMESDQIRSSLRESGLNWTQVDFCMQPKELNETLTLNEADLQKVRELCEKEYGLERKQLRMMNFAGQASAELVEMLQWESLLNGFLRSRKVVNNPILLLKQLQVTDVFLESSLSRSTLHNSQDSHCRLCARLDASSLQQFFRRRLRFLANKYGGSDGEYCYYIFQKLREEVCKVTLPEITSFRQLLAWRQLRSGLIDYCFRKRITCERRSFVQVGLLGVQQRTYEVEVTQHTLVSEVIDQICLLASVPVLFGYRLVVCFEDQELLLRPNELILPTIQLYNVKVEKAYSPTLMSTFKSIGKFLQLSEHGQLLLKQIIFYPLSAEEEVQQGWDRQLAAYQLKSERLIGLSRECRLELIVLFAIRQLQMQSQELPALLSFRVYEKFIPNSLEEEVQQSMPHLQMIYDLHRGASKSELEALIESRLEGSPLYRKHVWEMRVCELSEGLSSSKRVKTVWLGAGWSGVIVLTLNERVIISCSWADCQLTLGRTGLRVGSEHESITLKGLQLYQTYSVCREYQGLTEQAALLRSR